MLTPAKASQAALGIFSRVPVIPVITLHDPEAAIPLAESLVAGGLRVLEVTLRTECALECISRMRRVAGAVVGAGTVISPQDARSALDASAEFAVSPGYTDSLGAAACEIGLPLVPGASTASEAMRLYEIGHGMLKFFPAEPSGGVPALKSLSAPLPNIRFCPTGGVSAENAADYLRLPNVVCVGGSWVAPRDLIEGEDWDSITALALKASKLAR